MGKLIIISFAIIDIFFLILTVWVYSEMKKLTVKGYKLNILYLWLYWVYFAITNSLRYNDINLIGYIIGGLIVGLIWLIPNLIYFKKRKSLFIPIPPKTIEIDYPYKEEDTYNVEKDSVFISLEKLKDLKEKGVLTEEEFAQKKQELLQKIN